MKFLVDECTGPAVARWFRNMGYEAFSVFNESRGAGDDEILTKAYLENWILVTNDKDFGEMVVRNKMFSNGVILVRIEKLNLPHNCLLIVNFIEKYFDDLANSFTVIQEDKIRIRKL